MKTWKKIIAVVGIVSVLAAPIVHADVDLSGMSFDELIALKQQVDLALWASDEWQEVTVPAGVYEIGKDIPAGYWTIAPADGHTAFVYSGDALDVGGSEIDRRKSSYYKYQCITSPTDSYSEYNNVESVSWDLAESSYIIIEDSSVIFTPFTGHNLGFK